MVGHEVAVPAEPAHRRDSVPEVVHLPEKQGCGRAEMGKGAGAEM